MGQLSGCPYIVALCICFLIHKWYNESNKFEVVKQKIYVGGIDYASNLCGAY